MKDEKSRPIDPDTLREMSREALKKPFPLPDSFKLRQHPPLIIDECEDSNRKLEY